MLHFLRTKSVFLLLSWFFLSAIRLYQVYLAQTKCYFYRKVNHIQEHTEIHVAQYLKYAFKSVYCLQFRSRKKCCVSQNTGNGNMCCSRDFRPSLLHFVPLALRFLAFVRKRTREQYLVHTCIITSNRDRFTYINP